jgi:peptidoglycan L-alanyl-D-glutamate endopeptidase CwlK
MKTLLILPKKWRTLDERVKNLEAYLSDRLGGIYGKVTIDTVIQDLPDFKIGADGCISEAQLKKVSAPFRDKYDAIGIIPPHRPNERFWGAYYPNTDPSDHKMDFYVLTDEKTRMPRRNSNEYHFERSIEHELAGHGVSLDLGLKNQGNDTLFREGYDNTHYFFMTLDDKDLYYKHILEIWKKKYSILAQMLQASSKLLETLLGKKKIDNPTGVQIVPPLTDLLPEVKEKMDKLIQVCDILGMPIRVTSGFRSFEEQNKLYAQGRTTAGNIVTNAKGGESDHNFGKAFDIVFRKTGYEGDWEFVGKIGKQLGLKWGGDWKGGFIDKPHFYI